MRTAVLVLVLLSAVYIGTSEASWWSDFWDSLKKAVKDVVSWVKQNCSFGGGGIRCTLWRFRRDVHDVPDPAVLESENQLCDKIMAASPMLEQGFTFTLIKDVFQEVDRRQDGGAGDDVLDEEEFIQFMEALEVFHYCFSRA